MTRIRRRRRIELPGAQLPPLIPLDGCPAVPLPAKPLIYPLPPLLPLGKRGNQTLDVRRRRKRAERVLRRQAADPADLADPP